MKNKNQNIEPIPEQFDSYEQAGEFWDNHDTTDYLEDFETVEITSQLKNQHYEVEIDLDLIKYLKSEAENRQITVGYLVNQILREKIHD